MAKISRTWWGQKFMLALEEIMEPGRLQRGQSYRTPHRILSFEINSNRIKAKVRGNINPYFGVHKEPRYNVKIEMGTIAKQDWKGLIQQLGSNAGWITRLLLGEIPDDISAEFSRQGFPLLPESSDDFHTDCSCPDWSNPCKHIAGVYFRVAEMLDEDPFLLFELRGLPREELRKELLNTSLGKALAQQLSPVDEIKIVPHDYRYSQPQKKSLNKDISLKDFWMGAENFPSPSPKTSSGIPAILIKKEGDYPSFWKRDNSFIEAMESIYQHIRQKNRDSL